MIMMTWNPKIVVKTILRQAEFAKVLWSSDSAVQTYKWLHMLSVICRYILKFIFTVTFLLHHWFPYPAFSDHLLNLRLFLPLSSTAPYPQGPRIYLCPSSPSLSSGSLHLRKSCLLLSESSLAPRHCSPVSPVLRKSVSFSEELFLAASGRITLCQLLTPFVLNSFGKTFFS